MVDREQEQARLLAEAMGPEGRAGRDLAWIVAVAVLAAVLTIVTGFADRIAEWVEDLGGSGVGILLLVLGLLAVGSIAYAVRRYQDVRLACETLDRLANFDGLTGLPNRRFLGQPFDDMLTKARRQNGRVAVLFVDLSGLRIVNDVHGQEVGDQLIVNLTRRVTGALGPNDVSVRYAGDEFVLLCPDVTNAQSTERVAKRVLKAVETPFEFNGERLKLSASIGIAVTEERPVHADEILADAYTAMHQAKSHGSGKYALFDRAMQDKITPATAERRLRHALDNGEFRLYYQPIVSLWTKRLVGVEALLRWHDPNRGVVTPEEFVPALERSGLIVPVGNWVLDEVCRQSRRWQDDHPDRPALNVKINLSPRQLAQTGFIDHLRDCLEMSKADPDRVCLEVAERGLLYDADTVWSTLRKAKQLGVSLALDDFGTGFSSLSFLRQFSLDLLSIDKSFIDGIGTSREDTTIVEHIIGMSKALGIVTVAEGVQTEEQVEQLRAMNCDLAQGWYFSHPQPPDVISQLLERSSTKVEWRPPEPAEDSAAAPEVKHDRFAAPSPVAPA